METEKKICQALKQHPTLIEDDDSLYKAYAIALRTYGDDLTGKDLHAAWSIWLTSNGHGSIISDHSYEKLSHNTQEHFDTQSNIIRATHNKS